MQDLRIGSVLGRSFAILGKNFLPFAVLALALNIPAIYFLHDFLAQIDAGTWTGEAVLWERWTIVDLLNGVSGPLLSAALVYGTVMELRGSRAGFGRCIQVGLTRALPVIVVGILVSIATGLATVLLVVPGLIVMTVLYVAVPVAVIERPGIFESLSRSGELTRFFRLRIFALAVILGLATIGLALGLWAILDVDPTSAQPLAVYAEQLLTVLMAMVNAVIASVVYHDLRRIKDGVDVDQLAAIFE